MSREQKLGGWRRSGRGCDGEEIEVKAEEAGRVGSLAGRFNRRIKRSKITTSLISPFALGGKKSRRGEGEIFVRNRKSYGEERGPARRSVLWSQSFCLPLSQTPLSNNKTRQYK